MELQMRGIVPVMLVFSLVLVFVCYADTSVRRNEASSALARIQKSAPPDFLYQEYTSIMETYSRAERLWEENRFEEADKLYRLAALKVSLYEKKLATPAVAAAGESPATAGGQVPHVTPRAVPAPAPPVAAPVAVRQKEVAPVAKPAAPQIIIGKKRVYTVCKGDTLRLIGAKFGVDWRLIARQNRLNPAKFLRAGQKLTINTRRIVPKTVENGIVINIPDRTLYLFKNNRLKKALPVGLGMTMWREQETWRTPTGKFRILSKIKDPTWHVPVSIREKMKLQGKEVKTLVPPGDDNPLGKFALKTSLPGILIHGTIVPESVYTFSSHGCIRVHPDTMEEIFNEILVNTRGEIIYHPVKLAHAEDGRVYIEVHRDIYQQYDNLRDLARRLIRTSNMELLVDWDKVSLSLKKKSGIPEDVTRPLERQSLVTSGKHPPGELAAIH